MYCEESPLPQKKASTRCFWGSKLPGVYFKKSSTEQKLRFDFRKRPSARSSLGTLGRPSSSRSGASTERSWRKKSTNRSWSPGRRWFMPSRRRKSRQDNPVSRHFECMALPQLNLTLCNGGPFLRACGACLASLGSHIPSVISPTSQHK